MAFHSAEFVVFLSVVAVLYFRLPVPLRNPLLLASSAVFYMWWRPEYVLVILFSVTVDYFVALRLGHDSRPASRRMLLVVSLVTNLGVLFFFKYFRFAGEAVRAALSLAAVSWEPPALDLVLPIGISFHTFQALSYTIDVYRGVIPVERSLWRLWTFVLFFPQLVAGPIERAGRLLPQFQEVHVADPGAIASGLRRILWGLVKKVVIADRLALITDAVFSDPGRASGLDVAVAAYAFAFQIYADFSGYTDIAVGAARILGFRLVENFDRPYFASSPREFWLRWHISLSTWFRDYVYIPLGGARSGKARWISAILATFLLSGLWHGANWTYVVWGFYHGVLVLLSGLAGGLSARLPRAFKVVATFHLVAFGWIYFRSATIGDAHRLIGRLFSGPWAPGTDHLAQLQRTLGDAELGLAAAGVLALIGADLGLRPRTSPALRWAALVAGALLVLNARPDAELPFIYFQF